MGYMIMDTLFLSSADSPLGKLHYGIIDDKIVMMCFDDLDRLSSNIRNLHIYYQNLDICTDSHPLAETIEKQIREYFQGLRSTFDLPINPMGTDFQRLVWGDLIDVPFGQTISYHDQAKTLNNRKEFRELADAHRQNPIVIIIPCHRINAVKKQAIPVIDLPKHKRFLVDHEKKHM